MNKLLRILLVCLVSIVFTGCSNSKLKERVQVSEGVSVLMPSDYKKNITADGDVMLRSKVGSADLRVVAVKDMSIDTLTVDKLKEGLEINVTRFLEPMQGKLLHRKDTVTGKVVMSDFEFELGSTGSSKHGNGKFILKGNKFIAFLVVTPIPEPESDKSLLESFFNSIKIE